MNPQAIKCWHPGSHTCTLWVLLGPIPLLRLHRVETEDSGRSLHNETFYLEPLRRE
jgi:hypothetical protein